MSSIWSHADATTIGGGGSQEFDDVEKGLYENLQHLPVLPPSALLQDKEVISLRPLLSPVPLFYEGIAPMSGLSLLSLPHRPAPSPPANKAVPDPAAKKPVPPKPKPSRWIIFQLWFNTYRKFFTFVVLLNLAGIIMAALDSFSYAENHLGALVLGNLLCAILMRNELFLRFLYLIAIYGLRGVRVLSPSEGSPLIN
jgi:hypothetical protein